MTMLPLDIARRAARQECDAASVFLVTPDSPHVIREAAALVATAVTPLTLDEVRERVSFYVPRVAADAWAALDSLTAGTLPDWPSRGRGLVLLAKRVWDDALLLAGTASHELAHAADDEHATKHALGGVRHAAGYVLCDCVRGHAEGGPYTQNATAHYILGGADLDAWIEGACAVLRDTYQLSPHEVAVQRATLTSCAASLRALCFHGEGTPIARFLARCVKLGWEPPAEWRPAIVATEVSP